MQNNPEEVDILQFFSALGKIFQNIYNAIKNLLKNIFYYLLDGFLYLKKHYLYLTAGFLVGLILSFLVPKEESYIASARVRTNYDSQLALNKYIDLFNGIIKNEEYERLAKIFNIDKESAEHITKFEAEPVLNDNVLLLDEYEEFLNKKDTVVYKFIEFKDFKKSIFNSPLSSKYWDINVYSDMPLNFDFLNKSLVSLFDADKDLAKRRENVLFALETKKQKYLKSLQDIDTLRVVYNQVMLDLAKKSNTSGGSTNIVLSDKSGNLESPYNLFTERYRVLGQMENLSRKINKYSNILVLLNNFPKTAIKEKGISKNIHFKFSMFGFLLVLLVFLGKDFIAFLNRYQQQKENK